MNNKHSSHPLICIDFKKNRILNLSWEKFNIFRLEGNIYPDKKIALFSMDNIITKLPQTEFKSEIMGDEYAQL